MTNRRQALLAVLTMAMGSFNVARVAARGKMTQLRALEEGGSTVLTIQLDQWRAIVVKHGRESVSLSAAEIFRILEDKS